MGEHSVWGGAALGTIHYNDGGSSMFVGNVFRVTGDVLANGTITGGRVFLPAGHGNATLTAKLHTDVNDSGLAGPVVGNALPVGIWNQSKVIDVTGLSGWVSWVWDSPVTPDSGTYMISTGFGNTNYLHTAGVRAANADLGSDGVVLVASSGGVSSGYFWSDSNNFSANGNPLNAYAADLVVTTPDAAETGNVTDNQLADLDALGFSTGTLADRQSAYLHSLYGSDPASLADMQVALGKIPNTLIDLG